MVLNTFDLTVIEPVCQCSKSLPVVRTSGNLSSGRSSGEISFAGTSFPFLLSVGNPSPKITSLPGLSSSSQGYVTAPSFTNLSQVMFFIESMQLLSSS